MENISNKALNRNYAVDLLKLFLCIGVLVSHVNYSFYGGVGDKSNLPESFIFLQKTVLKGMFNGTFNVYLFCIISGYFASQKSLKTFRDLLYTCIRRYFLFFIPIFIFNVFCFIVYRFNLFYHIQLSYILNNDWLYNNYTKPLTILGMIKESIVLGSAYNQPLWMLPSLFLGNILNYFSSYLRNKIRFINIITFVLLVISTIFIKQVKMFRIIITLATFSGDFINILTSILSRKYIWLKRIISFLLFVFIGNMSFSNETILNWLYLISAIIIITLFIVSFIKYETNNFFIFLTKISFEIYIVHWPCFLCSTGGGIILLHNVLSYNVLYILSLLYTLIISVFLAYILKTICLLLIYSPEKKIISQLKLLLQKKIRS